MSSIYKDTDYLYAERLKGKRVTLTIKEIEQGKEFFCPQSNKKEPGFDIVFTEVFKDSKKNMRLGVTSITVKRQLYMATGTEETEEMVGKKIVLYPVPSKKSATGEAIRIAVPEAMA